MRIAGAVFIIMVMVVSGCKFSQGNKDVSKAEYPMLDSADVFRYDVVSAWEATPAAQVYAHKLYLNAIDLFINKKQVEQSLPEFLLSMRVAPDGYAAMKYAEALTMHGDYQAADDMLSCAEALDTALVSQVSMNKARVYGMQGDTGRTYYMLQMALASYPFDTKEVAADKAFAFIRDEEGFKILLAKYDVSNEERLKVLLTMFRRKFTRGSLPYRVPEDSLPINDGENIDYMYADIIQDLAVGTGRFSRMTEQSFQYMAELRFSEGFHTFIYRAVDYVSDTIPPVYYYVATVDTMGQSIARQQIGCYCSAISLKSPEIDSTGVIEVREIAQSYKKDPLEAGYSNNEVTKRVVMATRYYQIQTDGSIVSLAARPPAADATADAHEAVPKAPEVMHWETK